MADAFNHLIRKITLSTKAVSTLAGSAGNSGSQDGAGAGARFYRPYGVSASQDGTIVFVDDRYNHIIREIVVSSGVVTTLAGSANNGGSSDGTGSNARFFDPTDVVAGPDGATLFVADHANHIIRMIAVSTGAVSTLAGSAPGRAAGRAC